MSATVNLSPIFNGVQGLGATLAFNSGGKIFTYAAGTSNPLATYTDHTGNTQNSNPITIGSSGYMPNMMWLVQGSAYKIIVTLSDGVTQVGPTWDYIVGVNDFTATNLPILDGYAQLPTTTAGGTANALTGTFSPAITFTNKLTVLVRATATNTSTATFDCGSGALPIRKLNNQPLIAGDIAGAGHWLIMTADGTNNVWELANPVYLVTNSVVTSGVRQAVNYAPVDTAGLPNFIPATAVGLTLTTQNITTSAPLVVNAAGGYGTINSIVSPVSYIGYTTSNISWTLPNTATSYLYVDVNTSTGALTAGSTTLDPVYQQGGSASAVSGQNTFNIAQMTMYAGNGVTAVQVWRVFVGQATTSGGNIVSAISYAINAMYDSGFTSMLPAAGFKTTKNHNIGTYPETMDLILENTTAEGGFSIGDRVITSSIAGWDGANTTPQVVSSDKLSSSFTMGSTNTRVMNLGTGAAFVLTAANWKYKLLVQRGW